MKTKATPTTKESARVKPGSTSPIQKDRGLNEDKQHQRTNTSDEKEIDNERNRNESQQDNPAEEVVRVRRRRRTNEINIEEAQ